MRSSDRQLAHWLKSLAEWPGHGGHSLSIARANLEVPAEEQLDHHDDAQGI